MMHLTDEEMIEHAYGESEQAARVLRHLSTCRECNSNFVELERDLSGLDPMEAPARDAGYGERVWAAIAPSLPAYRAGRGLARFGRMEGLMHRVWIGFAYAAACALLVSVAFYAGRQWEQKKHPPAAAVQPRPQAKAPQPILVVVLDDHLDRSERFLVELKHADLDPAAMASPMREQARQLLAANRVCRKNAAEKKDPELNTALDHLDSLLTEAANAPGGLNARNIANLQDEMNSDGLLFEVRVLRARMAHGKAAGSSSVAAEGGTI